MSKIVVTGANGFVGQHLVRELLGNAYQVVAIDGSDLANGQTDERVTVVRADLSRPEEVAAIDFDGVSAVIHLAGLAAVGPSFDDPLKYLYTNPALQTNLFEAAIKQDAQPRFLVISSGSLYSQQAGLPITELSEVVPSSPYAVSKLTQEQLGHYYGNRGFEVLIARPFNHIGPGQNPGFIAPDLAQQIVAAEQDSTKKILVGNLDAKRDYTDVRDIVRAYRLLVEQGKPGETYNICSGQSVSGHDILDALLSESSSKPPVEQDPARMRPSDTPDIYGSHQKLTADTGWQPEITLSTTIHDIMADWRQR